MGQGLTSIAGQHYRVKDLKLAGNVPEHLLPALTISGSSASGVNAARQIGACVMGNLKPSWEYDGNSCDADLEHGVRLGVIVRETSQEAWAVAQRRFPFSPTGAAIREFATQMSDSRWNRELGKDSNVPLGHPYCIQPFKNYFAHSPFLIGSFEDVARELAIYLRAGLTTFLLEIPESAEDSRRITEVFAAANKVVRDS
jgi:alkanesulfonate monooxygenase